MKKFVKKLIKKIKNNFSKKIPVEYPVLNGNLLENRVAHLAMLYRNLLQDR